MFFRLFVVKVLKLPRHKNWLPLLSHFAGIFLKTMAEHCCANIG
jgi:hypothetical protein